MLNGNVLYERFVQTYLYNFYTIKYYKITTCTILFTRVYCYSSFVRRQALSFSHIRRYVHRFRIRFPLNILVSFEMYIQRKKPSKELVSSISDFTAFPFLRNAP